jgi:hypothetical protein
MARKDWYLSSSDHGHYLIDASKVKVAHEPILLESLVLRSVALLVAPQPEMSAELGCEAFSQSFCLLSATLLL